MILPTIIEFSEKLESGDEEGRPHERRCPMRGFKNPCLQVLPLRYNTFYASYQIV